MHLARGDGLGEQLTGSGQLAGGDAPSGVNVRAVSVGLADAQLGLVPRLPAWLVCASDRARTPAGAVGAARPQRLMREMKQVRVRARECVLAEGSLVGRCEARAGDSALQQSSPQRMQQNIVPWAVLADPWVCETGSEETAGPRGPGATARGTARPWRSITLLI